MSEIRILWHDSYYIVNAAAWLGFFTKTAARQEGTLAISFGYYLLEVARVGFTFHTKLKEFNDSQVLTVTNLVKFYRVEKSTSYLD